jgi:hypothetical protein
MGDKMNKVLSITLNTALVLTLSIASILGAYSIVNAATGGPDAYGYYYTDSNEVGGPSYSFVDISGTGTALGLSDDDYEYPVSIGFTFDFYGVSYTDIAVQSNGGLTFGAWEIDFTNYSLPYFTDPFIAVFWDDLDPSSGGEIYYQTMGSAPNRTFVVQWDGLPEWFVGGAVTFEVILYEGTNEILMQYADTDFGDASYDYGASATVGIQQDDSTALQYSYNSPDITNSLAILFYIPSANNPPDVPVLNSPGDGATDVVLTPDLVFDYSDPDSDDCTSFDLQVDDDAGFGSTEIDDSVAGAWSSGSSITYNVTTPLTPGTQYYWRVNVFDGTDWSGWSDGSWDFTTGLQSGGTDKDIYRTTEDVTFHATGFPPGSDVDVYVVEDFAWNDSDSIPPVPSTVFAFDTFIANVDGEISGTIWYAPLQRGRYDIVFDAGQDGIYDEIPDLVDDPNHPGFTVVSATVGGEVYSVDKTSLLLPWLGLALVLILAVGSFTLALRKRRIQ